MTRFERARDVLAALDSGKPARRPTPPPFMVRDVLCRECSVQILLAKLPSGSIAPLDRHPEGDLVIVQGVAITRGENHGAAPRFVLHFAACRRASGGQR